MEKALAKHDQFNYLDDGELIRRTQNGDTQAFNPIMLRYQEKIYDAIYGLVRHHETTEDLRQEVFLKAWQALPSFKGRSSLYSWLYRIAINCSIDFLRRQDREIVVAFAELPDNAPDVLEMDWTQASPHEILEEKEFRHFLSEGVRRLSVTQRRVFNLRHREGLKIKEIALRLGKPEPTIKTHLRQAHLKLRAKLRCYLQSDSLG